MGCSLVEKPSAPWSLLKDTQMSHVGIGGQAVAAGVSMVLEPDTRQDTRDEARGAAAHT